jgi:Gluconate 2-dehydrogenase subunit 3
MGAIDRRSALRLLAAVPLASAFRLTGTQVADAQEAVRRAGPDFSPQFFTPHEYRTVGVLGDLLLPADDRSGSATEAGVPQFMDFMMIDQPDRQVAMRGGLAWLDLECGERFGKRLVECSGTEQASLLDLIAWPDRAPDELSHGVEFFSHFRDLTATGFFTSKMGFEDLRYMGNEFVTEWTGCPDEALERLGLSKRN